MIEETALSNFSGNVIKKKDSNNNENYKVLSVKDFNFEEWFNGVSNAAIINGIGTTKNPINVLPTVATITGSVTVSGNPLTSGSMNYWIKNNIINVGFRIVISSGSSATGRFGLTRTNLPDPHFSYLHDLVLFYRNPFADSLDRSLAFELFVSNAASSHLRIQLIYVSVNQVDFEYSTGGTAGATSFGALGSLPYVNIRANVKF